MEISKELATYISEVSNKPLLTFEQERELSKVIQTRLAIHARIKDEKKRKKAENKDFVLGKAIEDITTHNLLLVIKEAFKFSRSNGVDVKNLIAAGNFGLIKAAYLYAPETHNTRFSTYATYWIRQTIFEAVHTNGIIRVPIHILNGKYRHNKINENGIVSDKAIMKEMDIGEKQLKRIRDSNIKMICLDQEISCGNSEDSNPTIGDFIADDNAKSPSEEAMNQDQYDYLHESMNELDDMSKDIVSAQYLADDKIQLRKLGLKYGLTGERIRQIKEKALKTLRKKIKYKMEHGSAEEK